MKGEDLQNHPWCHWLEKEVMLFLLTFSSPVSALQGMQSIQNESHGILSEELK